MDGKSTGRYLKALVREKIIKLFPFLNLMHKWISRIYPSIFIPQRILIVKPAFVLDRIVSL